MMKRIAIINAQRPAGSAIGAKLALHARLAGTLALHVALAFCAHGQNQNLVWYGTQSANWADMQNWTNATTQANPFLADFTKTNNVQIRVAPNPPANQNIDGVVVRDLQWWLAGFTQNLVITNKPFAIHRIFDGNASGALETHFHNNIAFNGANEETNNARGVIQFFGELTEYNGEKRLVVGGGAAVHFNGPVRFSRGLQNNNNAFNFYGMETTGKLVLANTVPNFHAMNNTSFYRFPSTGVTEYEYDFQPVKGVLLNDRFGVNAPAGVTVVFNAPVKSGTAETTFANIDSYTFTKDGAGILELNGHTNTFSGSINLAAGLLIVRGGLAPGAPNAVVRNNANPAYPGAALDSGGGSIDFDGVDVIGRNLCGRNGVFSDNDGLYRNQNPGHPSRFTGHYVLYGNNLGIAVFGGVGDIDFYGDFVASLIESSRRIIKTGIGTATWRGTMVKPAPTIVCGGTLILDYAGNNTSKLPEKAFVSTDAKPVTNAVVFQLFGNLTLRGNSLADTVQTVGNTELGHNSGIASGANLIRIAPEGRNENTAAVRFESLALKDALNASAVDFAPGPGGAIFVSNTVNNAALNTHLYANKPAGANLYPLRFTCGGESYARIADTPEASGPHKGYHKIERVPDDYYYQGFTGTTHYAIVDLPAGATTVSADTCAVALRFKEPGAATLTLDKHLRLTGEEKLVLTDHCNYKGGILVTSGVGKHPVTINGAGAGISAAGVINHNRGYGTLLPILQYNHLAPLVINAQIQGVWGGANENIVKAGPGELILTHPNSGIGRLFVHEGVVTFDEAADANGCQPFRCVSTSPAILLGNATLRYKGADPAGHDMATQVTLRGFGVIEASGAGPLRLTHASPFAMPAVLNPPMTQNYLLTLAGTGQGIIQNTFNLNGGRLRKRGTGTWTLGPACKVSAVWGADVIEGALVVNGSLGRDVRVGGADIPVCQSPAVQTGMSAPPTLTGTGTITRNLIVHANGVISITPDSLLLAPGSSVLTVGKNLIIESGAYLDLPRKGLPTTWTPVIKVLGKIEGTFEKPDNAYVDYVNGEVLVKERPIGTLLMVR